MSHDPIGRIITSTACMAEGADWLAAQDPAWARAYAITGPLPLRLRPDGFGALVSTIVSQQISVAAARSVLNRLETAGLDRAPGIRAASEDDLRGCGLSRQKITYLRALADSGIDFDALRGLPSDQVIKTLVAVKGIGQWSGEIYAMFALGRADVFAAGDLALQEAARILFELPERPTEREIRAMAVAWSPWRSVAAGMLWAYYHVEKSREGITT